MFTFLLSYVTSLPRSTNVSSLPLVIIPCACGFLFNNQTGLSQCSLNIFTWMSHKHLDLHLSKTRCTILFFRLVFSLLYSVTMIAVKLKILLLVRYKTHCDLASIKFSCFISHHVVLTCSLDPPVLKNYIIVFHYLVLLFTHDLSKHRRSKLPLWSCLVTSHLPLGDYLENYIFLEVPLY